MVLLFKIINWNRNDSTRPLEHYKLHQHDLAYQRLIYYDRKIKEFSCLKIKIWKNHYKLNFSLNLRSINTENLSWQAGRAKLNSNSSLSIRSTNHKIKHISSTMKPTKRIFRRHYK